MNHPGPGWNPGPMAASQQSYWSAPLWASPDSAAPPAIVINNTVAAPPHYLQCPPPRSGPNHLLHLILSVVTVGFWLPVWAIIAITDAVSRNHQAKGAGPAVGVTLGAVGMIAIWSHNIPLFLALAAVVAVAYLAYRAHGRTLAYRMECARIAARADAQHQAYLAGNDNGVYGQYPPPSVR